MLHLRRGVSQYAEVFCFMVVVACTLLTLARCDECSIHGLQDRVGWVSRGSLEENSGSVSPEEALQMKTLDNVCPESSLFCFPSTLPGYKSSVSEVPEFQSDDTLLVGSDQVEKKDSWSSNSGCFELSKGKSISCSLSYQDSSRGFPFRHCMQGVVSRRGPLPGLEPEDLNSKEHTGTVKPAALENSSPHVEIRPPQLDWGRQYLCVPSSAFLSVRNTHSHQILDVFEPYSNSSQFYPCNFSEISLAPGEVVLICFMFLPTWVGASSAQLVLQTSMGGFLIHAKGLAVESPYGVRPLVDLDVSTDREWRNNLSLFNPSNEAISVEELTAWLLVSSGNTSRLTSAVCSTNGLQGCGEFSLMDVEWLCSRSDGVDLPIIAMRPYRSWEIAPGKTETIMELDLVHHSEGKVFGAFSLELSSSSSDKVDTVILPLEVEWSSGSASDDFSSPVSVSLEVLIPCDTSGTLVAAVSIENNALHPLSVVRVSVVSENANLTVKYIEGLVLFPRTKTHAAVITYSASAVQKRNALPGDPESLRNCKLLILTNESRSSLVEIPCGDICSKCSGQNLHSSVGYRWKYEGVNNDNSETGRRISGRVLDSAKADELVLSNWKSQATAVDMSIVDEREVIFPTVEIGSHFSRWITVKNPIDKPVVMQLVLNSAEIVDHCRAMDRLMLPLSSSSLVGKKSVAPARYGFSLTDDAVTEAFVYPYGRALLGPVIFQPSARCEWKSSALIRNNLSGVEWLPLQGVGGSLSIALLEKSEPVWGLDFKLNFPASLNFSSPDVYRTLDETRLCSQRSLKELHAQNTGDLPLKVKSIAVSGTKCGLDGFFVHTCQGFVLEPGHSTRLIISFQSDFSAATLHRDLQLALTTGIHVIPMKASVSMHMFNVCKISIFWIRVKKFAIAVFLAASTLFVVCSFILPNLMDFGSRVYLFENGKSPTASVIRLGKSSHVLPVPKKEKKSSVTSQMNRSPKSTSEEMVLLSKSMTKGGQVAGQDVPGERDLTFSLSNAMPGSGYHSRTDSFPDTQKEIVSPSYAPRNSGAVASSDVQEAPRVDSLTINIRTKKQRRRRKKRCPVAGLVAGFEASSSHSGNSTPSSPLSPVTSSQLSPQGDQSYQSRHLFAQVVDLNRERSSDPRPVSRINPSEPSTSAKQVPENWCFRPQEESILPRQAPGKPVLFPPVASASSKLSSSSTSDPAHLVHTSTIAPHARAPGSKIHIKKDVKTEEKTGVVERYAYDIWGNHLFGKPPTFQSVGVSEEQLHATEKNSDSFFVRGPQTLIGNTPQKSVSFSFQVG